MTENICDIDIFKYLYDKIPVISQDDIKNNKYMCCGISYNVIKNKDILLNYYFNQNYNAYSNLFTEIVNISSERKINNKNINYYGEYIDEVTIHKDFFEIYNRMNYYEFIIFDKIDNEYLNKINDIITNLRVNDPIIICRSQEVFTIFKISNDEFFVIDSHIRFHGKISKNNNVVNYILINNSYKGVLSIGCFRYE
jgi:hypothetical protein